MSQERIPFTPSQESGWSELGGAGQVAMNVVVDGKGAVRRRPGIKEYFNTSETVVSPLGISGLYSTVKGVLYAVSEGSILKSVFRVTPAGVNPVPGHLLGPKRPTFAETQSLLVMASGGPLEKITLTTGVMEHLGGDPPPSTHVVAHASRLVTIEIESPDLLNNLNYSSPQAGAGIGGYETWNGDGGSDSGPFPANARPDPVVALAENTNELFAFGSSNLQNFAPDAQSVYSPINTREFGCSAPYSIIRDDQNFAWIDDRRRIVHSDGRTFNIISDPIKQVLDDMDVVSDCFGFRVVRGTVDSLVWVFPSDGRAFAFQRGGGWSQWSSWDPANNNWGRFLVSALASQLSDNANIVGLTSGRLGKMDNATGTDLGQPINAYVTTGFLNHGTQNRKHCASIQLTLKRGKSTKTNVPVAHIAWRDDLGKWGQPLEVSIGEQGDNEIVVRFRSLGIYRERQWRFSFMGEEELVLGSVTEDFEILEN